MSMRRYIISALRYVVIGLVVAGYIITAVKLDALREDTRQLREESAVIQAEREEILGNHYNCEQVQAL